ncbi:MAG: hypothetical protein J6T26_09815 [Firmicutes bacterium]|nr:hypothetical protein [Bacillota bacterium]
MKVMIHACPRRMWYVEKYLVPSLIEQGIPAGDVQIWNDSERRGNQLSWFDSCASLDGVPGGTWHLQDDVLIARDFARRAAAMDDGIVAGWCCEQFGPNVRLSGVRPGVFLFNSFPCIRIPNDYAADHARWYWESARKRRELHDWVMTGKKDDSFFHLWIEEEHGDEDVLNAVPCFVEHVDWLIGGSVLNANREKIARAYYWDDEELVRELAAALGKEYPLPR